MATQKPAEWVSSLITRFEEQVSSIIQLFYFYQFFHILYRQICRSFVLSKNVVFGSLVEYNLPNVSMGSYISLEFSFAINNDLIEYFD